MRSLRRFSTQNGSTITATGSAMSKFQNLPSIPTFASLEAERKHLKHVLAASFRIFSRLGFDEGVAGHITARDPEYKDTFWVNPFGLHFSQITEGSLIRVNHDGKVVEGENRLNAAAFAIHSRIHAARPDVVAAAHTHSIYGRAWSATARPLSMISQDACAFYNDHVVFNDFGGVVVELDEGKRIAEGKFSHSCFICFRFIAL